MSFDTQQPNNVGENRGRFVKGDPRCWRGGRPRTSDQLRELGLKIADETIKKDGKEIIINGHSVTTIEAILRSWATSKSPELQKLFVMVCYGKIPADKSETSDKPPLRVIVLPSDDPEFNG